ncbi:putative peptidoglycan muropeptide transporter SLC46 [Dermatophagoides pteronyssinus]|uniref:putative peptidoglycan muropeptide transporter SLC46 n=1 Tax=Dermatophagoides pteronyssinus TaxID=6956 RepID=UPI003F6767A8
MDEETKKLSWHHYVNIRQLRVEPFILLYMIGFSLSAMAVSQLVQDKLCRVDYDQSSIFCISINSADFDHGGETIKSNIIKDATYITLYRTLLSTLPCIIWALFLGPWSDNYVNGRKYIMIVGAIAAALESIILIINASLFDLSGYYVLLSFIPSAFTGGIVATLMAIYAYCSATSDKYTRSTRFAIVEICFWIAQPIGSFIGGQILGDGDQNTKFQLYNYIPVFVVSLCAHIAAIIWAILVIDEQQSLLDLPQPIRSSHPLPFEIDQPDVEPGVPVTCINSDREEILTPNESMNESYAMNSSLISFNGISQRSRLIWNEFLNIFHLDHVSRLWRTLIRQRSHWGREQIWILFFSTAFLLLVYLNTTFVLWSYVEKLFSWPPKFYSNITSMTAIGTLILMGLVLPIFVHILQYGDLRLALLGVLSLMGQCILRGSWQHEIGLYLSFIAGTLAPLSVIGIRSRLSKIIENDERGKLFALLAIVEAVTPGIASLFYSIIFTSTIDVYPGLVFQVAAFILLIPLLAIIFIDTYCIHDYDKSSSSSDR